MQKKALTLKKSTKSTPAYQKKQATEKKHYGAFKSTHYDPCNLLLFYDVLYQDKLTTDKKPTVGYSILNEIPSTCFQLCELV